MRRYRIKHFFFQEEEVVAIASTIYAKANSTLTFYWDFKINTAATC